MGLTHTPTLLGFFAVLLWSALAALTALKGGDIPPFQTTAIAFLIGGMVIAIIAAARGDLNRIKPTPASFALGLYGLFAYHALYFAALKYAPPAEAHLLNSLWALLIVLFSGLLPGHHLKARHIAGAVIGFAAGAMLVWDKLGGGGADASLGFLFAAGCALVWSSYSVASRLVHKVPSESLALTCLAAAALAFLCHRLFETTAAISSQQWLALAVLGAGPTGIAFLLWDIGMKRGNVTYLGTLAYASPVLSTLLLVALGLAAPSAVLALACGLIVLGAWVARPE
jgi:drug/metabolite transporter (DMT)-like permease